MANSTKSVSMNYEQRFCRWWRRRMFVLCLNVGYRSKRLSLLRTEILKRLKHQMQTAVHSLLFVLLVLLSRLQLLTKLQKHQLLMLICWLLATRFLRKATACQKQHCAMSALGGLPLTCTLMTQFVHWLLLHIHTSQVLLSVPTHLLDLLPWDLAFCQSPHQLT